jgi:hypothetical protein
MRHSLSEAQQIIDKGLVMIRPNPEPAYIPRARGWISLVADKHWANACPSQTPNNAQAINQAA